MTSPERSTAPVSYEIVDPRSPAARSAMASYFAELDQRFPDGFDASTGGGDDLAAFDRPHGAFVLVVVETAVAGCGALQSLSDGACEIKRMWIAPASRGRNLASGLLAFLERLGADLGCSTVRLDTNATLHAAIALYQRSGYSSIDRYNDNPYAQRWFEKRLD